MADEELRQVATYVPVEIVERLAALAIREDRSVSYLIRTLIEAHLPKLEKAQ